MDTKSSVETLVPSDKWGEYVPCTPQEAELSKGVLLKQPALQAALIEYSAQAENMTSALRLVAQELRACNLNPVERRVLLRYAGWNNQRISEIGRIVDADKKTFDRYMQSAIGYQLALQEARGRVSGGGGAYFLERGDPKVVKPLKAYFEAYKGLVPTKGTVRLEFVKDGVSFKLAVRTVKKKKKAGKGGAS